ncbi:hypothetical protein NS383_17740 [Pseudomonas oryzihabitans]|nr:hypothetical protein NS383_17740 [Pseudomonas psychrotolerans]
MLSDVAPNFIFNLSGNRKGPLIKYIIIDLRHLSLNGLPGTKLNNALTLFVPFLNTLCMTF